SAHVHPDVRSVNYRMAGLQECRIAESRASLVRAIVAAFALSVSALPVTSSPANQFLNANGIRLQYVDWGGTGDVVLFLPGLAIRAGTIRSSWATNPSKSGFSSVT